MPSTDRVPGGAVWAPASHSPQGPAPTACPCVSAGASRSRAVSVVATADGDLRQGQGQGQDLCSVTMSRWECDFEASGVWQTVSASSATPCGGLGNPAGQADRGSGRGASRPEKNSGNPCPLWLSRGPRGAGHTPAWVRALSLLGLPALTLNPSRHDVSLATVPPWGQSH